MACLIKMVFDYLWVVLDVFEVVVEFFWGACRWLQVFPSFVICITTPRFELTRVLPRNDKQMSST